MAKNSFVLYKTDCLNLLELSNEELGEFFRQIILYQNDGVVPVFSDLKSKIIFQMFKRSFDSDSEKYQKTCEIRSKNGKIGGEANASKRKQMLANGSKSKQNIPESVSESDPVSVSEPDVSIETNKKEIKEKKSRGRKPLEKRVPVRDNPPTLEQVETYINSKGYSVSSGKFFRHYSDLNWKIGGKRDFFSWEAKVDDWNENGFFPPQPKVSSPPLEDWEIPLTPEQIEFERLKELEEIALYGPIEQFDTTKVFDPLEWAEKNKTKEVKF